MSDVCVCGCTIEEHQYEHEESHYPEFRSVTYWRACEKHNCGNFRPCLDWPNAEGWWARSSDGAHVFYESHLDAVLLAGDPHSYSRIAYEYKSKPIIDRFTPCEPNPFERQ